MVVVVDWGLMASVWTMGVDGVLVRPAPLSHRVIIYHTHRPFNCILFF